MIRKYMFCLKLNFIFVILLSVFYSSCIFAKYNWEIRQGDLIFGTYDFYIGMHKDKVEQFLGKPVIIPLYNMNYWCYYYYCKPNNHKKKMSRMRLVFFFENDILVSYIYN